jgi:hypothetical protein
MEEINFAMSCIKQTVIEFMVPFLHFWVEGHTSHSKKVSLCSAGATGAVIVFCCMLPLQWHVLPRVCLAASDTNYF